MSGQIAAYKRRNELQGSDPKADEGDGNSLERNCSLSVGSHLYFPARELRKQEWEKIFMEKYPASARVFEQVSHWLDLDMPQLCFEENDKLDLTEYTQAALLTACLAMEKATEEYGLIPEVTAGLSLGEYCANKKQLAESA